MASKIDFTNTDIGDLHVKEESVSNTKATYWNCVCKCGKNVTVSTRKLNSGNVKNCGYCKIKRKDKSKFTK